MKKVLLLAVGVIFSAALNAQSSSAVLTKEMIHSDRPADAIPKSFKSKEELDLTVPQKVDELKQLILDNQTNKDKVFFYREEIWRYENAVVEGKRNSKN